MSSTGGLGEHKMAHRIIREHSDKAFPEFHLGAISTPTRLLFALQGLSPFGDPMVDPTTGNPTKFAFTGDPVSKSGWIDDRTDVRSLQSIAPFDLAPSEVRSLTVVWLIAKGKNLKNGLELFRAQYDLIMSRREMWDF